MAGKRALYRGVLDNPKRIMDIFGQQAQHSLLLLWREGSARRGSQGLRPWRSVAVYTGLFQGAEQVVVSTS